jgi:hypothetical protein
MSQTQQQIDLFIKWILRITLSVAAFLLVSVFNDLKTDVKVLLNDNAVMKEKVSRIERTIDRIENKE